jgi:hypothetical protein
MNCSNILLFDGPTLCNLSTRVYERMSIGILESIDIKQKQKLNWKELIQFTVKFRLSEDSRVHPEAWGPERPIHCASWYPRPLRQHWWLISFQFLATEKIPMAGQTCMRTCVRIFTCCSVMPQTFQYSLYPSLALLTTQYISIRRSPMNYVNNIHIAIFTRTPQIRPRTRSSSKEPLARPLSTYTNTE